MDFWDREASPFYFVASAGREIKVLALEALLHRRYQQPGVSDMDSR